MYDRLFNAFYGTALFFLFLLMLPKFIWQLFFSKKYRRSWQQRFGCLLPKAPPSDKTKIWVHAVSVGEAKAIIPLINQMHGENIHWIISSTTETGYDEVKRSISFPITQIFLPLDFKCLIDPILRHWQPSLVLISETDLWYNFLSSAHVMEIPIVLVNGKISERSTARFKKFQFFADRIFSLITLFCVQNQTYAERFLSLGVPSRKISVTGNLKWDQQVKVLEDPEQFRKQWGIAPDEIVVVIGSTHPDEEKLLLDALYPLLKKHVKLRFLVVPRHPERFEQVGKLINSYDINRITLIDRMGILMDCYQIAKVVLVGGSFVPGIGGHNILEPCQAGTVALFGPYMSNQEEMVSLVLDNSAGAQVPINAIANSLDALLSDPVKLAGYKLAVDSLKSGLKGVSDKVIEAIKPVSEIIFNEELAKKNRV